MSLFATIRSADRWSLQHQRPVVDQGPRPAEHLTVEASLPRHLLVSLAGITADVTTLQHARTEDPQLHAALGTILSRLDGLVDSVYTGAVVRRTPGAPGAVSNLPSPHVSPDHGGR